MTIMLVLTMTGLLGGCKTLPSSSASLTDARALFEAGEIYQSKKVTEAFLAEHPEDAEGVQLMGQILETEISGHKEAFATQAPEEMEEALKEDQVKTLMERGRSLMEIGAYDEAAHTVEGVFEYSPENIEASRLLDEIQKRAVTAGKDEMSKQAEVVRAEVEDRVFLYKRQAMQWIQEGKWGAARLAVEKILMLRPEDEEALKMLEDVKSETRG